MAYIVQVLKTICLSIELQKVENHISLSLKSRVGRFESRYRSSAVQTAGFLFVAVIWTIFGTTLYREHQDISQRARQHADNIALIVQRDISRNFELFGLSLSAITENWNSGDVAILSDRLKRLVLFDRSLSARDVTNAVVVDRTGRVVFNLAGKGSVGQSLAERPWFKDLERTNDQLVHVSDPYISGLSQKEVVAVWRRIASPSGLEGAAVLFLSVDYFTNLFDGLNVGTGGTFTIFGKSGLPIVSTSANKVNRLASTGAEDSELDAVMAVLAVPHDSLLVYRTAPDTGIKVQVELAAADVYRPWWGRMRPIAIALALLTITLLFLCCIFGAELRARREAEDRLKSMVNTDELTGLANRRSIDRLLSLEAKRLGRQVKTLHVLFIDVDFFKKMNDRFGHQRGDEVLQSVAVAIKSCVHRPSDLAGRYGGEEFLVMLAQTDGKGAELVAERIRTAVEELDIPHPAGIDGRVTVSVGVAGMNEPTEESISLLVQQADEALYRAKAGGRNKVEVFS